MLAPAALLTVNCIQVTFRAGNAIESGEPLFGNVPTGTVLPSLELSVPDTTLSVKFGRS
jgi:hypothetical protein